MVLRNSPSTSAGAFQSQTLTSRRSCGGPRTASISWQSILRGAGVITGSPSCADVPGRRDYAALLQDALEHIPESTPAKQARADAMAELERAGKLGQTYSAQARWIGALARQSVDRD